MRRDLFERCGQSGVFFDKVFDSTDRDPPVLEGEEEGLLVAFLRQDLPALFQIFPDRRLHLISEVDDGFVTALAVDPDSLFLEVNIIQIQTDTLGDPDSGAQQESEEGHVAKARLVVEAQLVFGELCAAVSLVQHVIDLVRIQADNGLLAEFGEGDQGGDIPLQYFRSIEVLEHAADRRELARLPAGVVCKYLSVLLIVGQIFEKFFDILLADLLQNADGIVADCRSLQGPVFMLQKLKKHPKIIGIGKTRAGTCRLLNSAEILPAEARQFLKDLPHLFCIADFLFTGILFRSGFRFFVCLSDSCNHTQSTLHKTRSVIKTGLNNPRPIIKTSL